MVSVTRRVIFFSLLLIGTLFIVIGWAWYTKAYCYRLNCISFGETTYHISDVYEEKKGSVYRAVYNIPSLKGGQMRVDVREAVDEQTAIDYIRGRVAGMKALYDNIRSPYPGLLTNEIQCDQEFKPTYETFVTKQGIEVQEIVGYLNDRMTFGSCEKTQIHFKGTMLLFACRDSRQLYQIEFISPIDTYEADALKRIVRSVTCT